MKPPIRTYISLIDLNVNGLNTLTKRHRDWMNTETRPIHMLSTRDLETHTDWKWVDGKKYSKQLEIKTNPEEQFSYQTKETLKKKIMWKRRHYVMIER